MEVGLMKTVAVLALNGVIPFDLGIACDIFSWVRLADGKPAYKVIVCSVSPQVDAGDFEIRTRWDLKHLKNADLVIVPGIKDLNEECSASALSALQAAHRRGAVVASICTGAFILAEAGLLNGRRATTHWAAAAELARRYPDVDVDPKVLYVDTGDIVTSAGASAGLDMCLHLVRKEHGQAIAAHSARLAVAPLHREGGQAQFIHQEPPSSGASLAPVLDWLTANLHKSVDIPGLAKRAGMTSRTFARRFREQTGTTPIQWLLTSRIRRAQELIETSSASIDQIAAAAGFESPVTFRARFQRLVGLSPSAYRRRYNEVRL